MWRVLRGQTDFSNTTRRNQLTSLVLYENIITSRLNAKNLVPFVDRFFNRIKAADLNAKKYAHSILLDKNAVKKTFEDILPRYEMSSTNYVRAIASKPRKGDNAKQMIVLLIKEAKIEPVKATIAPKVALKSITDSKDSK